jgi:hypothetical protein
MRPILLPAVSVNQSAPSGPNSIDSGWELAVGTGYSVIALWFWNAHDTTAHSSSKAVTRVIELLLANA